MTRQLFPDDGGEKTGSEAHIPLADRMRPRHINQVLGQNHLLVEGRFLCQAIRNKSLPSMILWGPPGVGKTTLARVLGLETLAHFVALSAVLSGVRDVKKVVESALYQRRVSRKQTILFVDEIHRFNKAQQDAFLPHVENGTLTLIGATTENPSFALISPLLSRTRVVVLKPLEEKHLMAILQSALADAKRGLGRLELQPDDGVLESIATFADGDARAALNALEVAAELAQAQRTDPTRLTAEIVQEALQRRSLHYDKAGEEHYNVISALHKSLRNSDCDAGLYWLGRLLEAGEDPLYVARRLVRFASEDVGMADPMALGLAIDALQTVQFIGLPEGKLALAQLTVYLAQAPKSNSLYRAYMAVEKEISQARNEPVPLHLRNAPTRLMKELGYGEGYRYAPDEAAGVASMDCLPPRLRGVRFFEPGKSGYEEVVGKRLQRFEKLKRQEET